jgi:malate synthase
VGGTGRHVSGLGLGCGWALVDSECCLLLLSLLAGCVFVGCPRISTDCTTQIASPRFPSCSPQFSYLLFSCFLVWSIDVGFFGIYFFRAGLLSSKGGHPRQGATCAWVPSPTAATLHALHYHFNSVTSAQARILAMRRRTTGQLRSILRPPLATKMLEGDTVAKELDECAQLILGYVVRWVEFGVGCSKVPDLNNVGKMEDRATLRISSQLLSNWLKHGIITTDQLHEAFGKWAVIVDQQNQTDKEYRPMSTDKAGSIAYQAGLRLCTEGTLLPNGYTESVLHTARLAEKSRLKSSKM